MRNETRRGQATVETALGMLVFVTVLMFGVYFGEVSVMNMKVSEAANAAMWDASAAKLHDYSALWSQNISGPAAAAAAGAAARYKNFDGRTAAAWPSVAPNGGTFTGAFTRASGMTVQCSSNNSPNYTRFPYPPLWIVFPNPDNGVTCQATARAEMIRVPTRFVDQGNGLFAAPNRDSAAFSGMTMCASGRPSLGGACRNNGFGTLMDDFGYMTGNGSGETGNCSLLPYNVPCPGNFGYWTAGFTVWLVNTFVPPGSQDSSDQQLVQGVFQSTPWWPWAEPLLGPTGYGMSSCQEGFDFLCLGMYLGQNEIWASDGMFWSWQWATTPFWVPFGVHVVAYAQRDTCYLGRACGTQEGNWNP